MLELNLAPADPGMDWLQFIAAVIGAVAWPIAAVAIAWMFKRQISALLDKVRRLSWGDGTIDLGDKLTQAEAVAIDALPAPIEEFTPEPERPPSADLPTDSEPAAPEHGDGATHTMQSQWGSAGTSSSPPIVARRLHLTPESQVNLDWQNIEAELRKIPVSGGRVPTEGMSVTTLIELLAADGKVDPWLYSMLKDLATIHRAAGAGGVTLSDAWRFQSLANQVLPMLRKVRERYPGRFY